MRYKRRLGPRHLAVLRDLAAEPMSLRQVLGRYGFNPCARFASEGLVGYSPEDGLTHVTEKGLLLLRSTDDE